MNIQIFNFLKILGAAINDSRQELLEPDWEKLYDYSQQHFVQPLFYEGCHKYQEFHSLPEDMRNKYLSVSLDLLVGQVRRTEAFLEVYDKLVESGLRPLVLKGLICRNTYGGLMDHRPSGDEDIYIKKEEFQSCKETLLRCGFIMEDIRITDRLLSEVLHISFYHPGSRLTIEVHLSFLGRYNKLRKKMDSYFDNAFETAVSEEICGHKVDTLNPTNHFLFLFFHFYKHFTIAGAGIRQILDMAMYAGYYRDKIAWEVIEKSIREISADRLYGDIVRLNNQFFGFDMRTGCAGYDITALLEDVMETGIFGNSTREQSLGGQFMKIALESSGGLFQLLFPGGAILRSGYPVLYDRPYLLPAIWIVRLHRFVKRKEIFRRKLIRDSLAIGRCRLKLLKNYSII